MQSLNQKLLPKYYADVNSKMPREYWDYENYEHDWNSSQDHYELIQKIGRGKYSEVFKGVDNRDYRYVVVKVLKPVRKKKIRREIKILQIVKGGPNIIDVKDIVRDPITKTPSLIFDYLENVDFKSMFPKLKDQEVRYYLYQLLKALDYSHSKGIMHRDVKPQNIIVEPISKTLKLIDWGLAEFYHPKQDYNVRVASRYFKGPELLVDNLYYDYSLDIWSTGAMFASIIFQKEPFFQGSDNYDQLVKIAKVLGTDDLKKYLHNYHLQLDKHYDSILGRLDNYPKRKWESFITEENKHLCHNEAIDLLSKMLIYDHVRYGIDQEFNIQSERITPKDAMIHSYFDPVRNGLNQ